MATKEFDPKSQELFTALVEIAYEFANRNEKEIDELYIYGTMENHEYYYNVFFKINNDFAELHNINTVLTEKCDNSKNRAINLLRTGTRYLKQVAELFKNDNRDIPTLMKMVYSPKTGKFNNDIYYDLKYSNHSERTADDGFEEWYEEISSS